MYSHRHHAVRTHQVLHLRQEADMTINIVHTEATIAFLLFGVRLVYGEGVIERQRDPQVQRIHVSHVTDEGLGLSSMSIVEMYLHLVEKPHLTCARELDRSFLFLVGIINTKTKVLTRRNNNVFNYLSALCDPGHKLLYHSICLAKARQSGREGACRAHALTNCRASPGSPPRFNNNCEVVKGTGTGSGGPQNEDATMLISRKHCQGATPEG
ncbi:hypothetical protein ARMGADRAFT_1029695 [Armillaria gallica]|uniref:Uncharacterized protein n=1 Tax=Armillaria gallica TaxID=47427 RepID=A0A2H3DSI5_ARMGA|nr:hypothetical protein ARMGADRAFT_1029695 [Armillaria gallica]